jgi:hypothetical protein
MDFSTHTTGNEAFIPSDRLRGLVFGAAVGEALATSNGRYTGRWGHATAITLAATQAFVEAAEEGFLIETALEGEGRAGYLERIAGAWDTLAIGKRKIRLGRRRTPCWANQVALRVLPAATFFAHRIPPEEDRLPGLLADIAAKTNTHPDALIPAVELCYILMAVLAEEEVMPSFYRTIYFKLPALEEGPHRGVEAYRDRTWREDKDKLSELAGVRMRKTVLEAVGISPGKTWSCVPGFKAAVLEAAIRTPDRDTVGALTGMLLGAQCGLDGIPRNLLDGLEGETIVDYVGEMLCDWFLLD